MRCELQAKSLAVYKVFGGLNLDLHFLRQTFIQGQNI